MRRCVMEVKSKGTLIGLAPSLFFFSTATVKYHPDTQGVPDSGDASDLILLIHSVETYLRSARDQTTARPVGLGSSL